MIKIIRWSLICTQRRFNRQQHHFKATFLYVFKLCTQLKKTNNLLKIFQFLCFMDLLTLRHITKFLNHQKELLIVWVLHLITHLTSIFNAFKVIFHFLEPFEPIFLIPKHNVLQNDHMFHSFKKKDRIVLLNRMTFAHQ